MLPPFFYFFSGVRKSNAIHLILMAHEFPVIYLNTLFNDLKRSLCTPHLIDSRLLAFELLINGEKVTHFVENVFRKLADIPV